MVDSVKVTTKGIKRTKGRQTVSVFLRPKNKEKCRRILNPKKLHAADARRPPRFTLPKLEGLGGWLASTVG